jgi:hypothetical protein
VRARPSVSFTPRALYLLRLCVPDKSGFFMRSKPTSHAWAFAVGSRLLSNTGLLEPFWEGAELDGWLLE